MTDMENARPGGTNPRASAEPVGGTYRQTTYPGRVIAIRRTARRLDDLFGIMRPPADVSELDWYHVTGLDLGVIERELAGVT